jgi:hypothetical protein
MDHCKRSLSNEAFHLAHSITSGVRHLSAHNDEDEP